MPILIALGQGGAGDDGVGHEVARRLARQGLPRGVEVHEVQDSATLLSLLLGFDRAVVVDAAVGGGAPGTVLSLDGDALARWAATPVSSHGLGLREALALARMLAPAGVTPDVRIVAVCIDPPRRFAAGLSPEVEAAVPLAVEAVRAALAREESDLESGRCGASADPERGVVA